MASVDNVYSEMGIIHSSGYCSVCEVVHTSTGSLSAIRDAIDTVFYALFVVLIIGVIAVASYFFGYFMIRGLEWKRPPLEQMWEKYNHISIYEDGSYSGERRDGKVETGCMSGGLCNLD